MDIYKCPFSENGGRELKFSYIISTVPPGPFLLLTFYFLLYILGNYTRYRIGAAAPCGVMLMCISNFGNVTIDGLSGGEMNIHICYDKI